MNPKKTIRGPKQPRAASNWRALIARVAASFFNRVLGDTTISFQCRTGQPATCARVLREVGLNADDAYRIAADTDCSSVLPPIVLTRSTHDRLALLISLLHGREDDDLLEFLDQELARANLVNDEDLNCKTAALGSQIEYLNNLTGLKTVVTLTYPTSENSVPPDLSVLTPQGACILGLSEGQSMQYWTAKGLVCDVTLHAVLKGTASLS